MIYLASITISFGITLWLSKFFISYIDPTMFLDRPTVRKLHDNPVPRYGGIVFGITILFVGAYLVGDIRPYLWYFLGLSAFFFLGALDDYFTLSWKVKLPVQLAIGVFITVQFLGKIDTVTFFHHTLGLSEFGLVALYLFWFIGIVNAVNLIDGMDGLAGGFMLLTTFSAAIIGWIAGAYVFVLINSVIIGAMIGFLHFNQKPAKFFMGDAGSLLLGYHLAVLPLLFNSTAPGGTTTINITPILILTSYLIIDTARVFFVRLRARKNPLEPDMNHLHHIMYRSSNSYHGTLFAIFVILAISGVFAILDSYIDYNNTVMVIYLIALSLLIFSSRITTRFVNVTTSVIRATTQHQLTYTKKINPFRVRFIPIVSVIYFISLLINLDDLSYISDNSALILLGLGMLLLYVFFSPRLDLVAEIIIIAISIFHGVLLLQLNVVSDANLTASLIRYISLGILSVITMFNYIINSKNLSGEFWSVIDLLIGFILVGLISLHPLGIGISPLVGFELGIIYLSNKLFAPRVLWGKELATATTKA